MIQRQLKLKLTNSQERDLERWLFHLTSVWNWAIRKIELDAVDGFYYSRRGFHSILAGHGKKIGIPSHTLQGVLSTAWTSWDRCFKRLSRRPRFKGQRNRLNSIPLPDPISRPRGNRITIPAIKSVSFHGQNLPEGKVKNGRLIKRASGWYLCLFIDTEPNSIPLAEPVVLTMIAILTRA